MGQDLMACIWVLMISTGNSNVLNAAGYKTGNDELQEWRTSWGLTITSAWKSGC
ncbi:hypothetical protein COLO4_07933 [Corchorus olitorius]|uniref:Uncharacterized protein n=1 Tax=Corchorus olitorius TaxID=93759 RepID=A0A1R3KI30_9ROSI|nr:hypothetical protein COLO4_07933 [Corchorus olitorius]